MPNTIKKIQKKKRVYRTKKKAIGKRVYRLDKKSDKKSEKIRKKKNKKNYT